MKITDKIVTSITQPQQTNVLWHNPETGELKMFGNNGWEVAGGGKLPETVESGWVLDKATGGIASRFTSQVPNTCSYQSRDKKAWVFYDNPGLVTGEIYELTEVDADNKVSVVCLGNPGGAWTSESNAYAFEGDLDTSKVYSYGTINISNTASGMGSVASGVDTIANEQYSHSEGKKTIASGIASHAEGYDTVAQGKYSHAEGVSTTAIGNYSHAEGESTAALGGDSHAEGNSTTAQGAYSHAEGYNTFANGGSSHTEGYCTTASSEYQHVQGKYNIKDPNGIYQFIIGNGWYNSPSNAFAVKWDGTIVVWKDINTPLELTPDKLEKLLALVD